MMPYQPVSARTPRLQAVAFAGVLIAGTLVRSIHLFKHATMPDEAFTFYIAAHPLHAIASLLRTGDFHPPLLYIIGNGLFHLTSKAYLFRVVSVLFGAAGIAATYWLAVMLVPRYAVLAAALVAINPALVFFDRYFRMYAMVWSLAMLSWALLAWALSKAGSALRWTLYALTLAALLYTQYLAFFTLAAQLLYMALFHRSVRGFWYSFSAACLAFAPWLPSFLAQYPLGGTAYRELTGHLAQALLAPTFLLIDSLPAAIEYSPITAALLWLLLVCGVAVAVARKQWLAFGLASPIVLQVLYSIVSGKLLLGERYLLQGIAPAIMLMLLFVDWLSATKARVAGVVVASILPFLMLFGTVDELFLSPYQPIDWTEYSRFLATHMQRGDAIVLDSSMLYYVLIGSPSIAHRPVFQIATAADIHPALERSARYPRVWYVDYQSHLPDPDHAVFDGLAKRYPKNTAWRADEAGYGDTLLTVLFERPAGAKRGP